MAAFSLDQSSPLYSSSVFMLVGGSVKWFSVHNETVIVRLKWKAREKGISIIAKQQGRLLLQVEPKYRPPNDPSCVVNPSLPSQHNHLQRGTIFILYYQDSTPTQSSIQCDNRTDEFPIILIILLIPMKGMQGNIAELGVSGTYSFFHWVAVAVFSWIVAELFWTPIKFMSKRVRP